MDEPKSVTELKDREKEHVRRIHGLVRQHFFAPEFSSTRKSLYTTLGLTLAVGTWLRLFRRSNRLNTPILISLCLGGSVHFLTSMSRDVQQVCISDTPLGNTMRKHYQQISQHNILIPYYRKATIQAKDARENRGAKTN